MKKIIFPIICVLILAFAQTSAALAAGFQGPSSRVVTVDDILVHMRDDAPIAVRGNIVQHLGGEKYLFKDATGTIAVVISEESWNGIAVTPGNTVELHGSLEKDMGSVEIEVERVVKVK